MSVEREEYKMSRIVGLFFVASSVVMTSAGYAWTPGVFIITEQGDILRKESLT